MISSRQDHFRRLDSQFFDAIFSDNLEKLLDLLFEGADINCVDEESGAIPLHFAAESGNVSMVKFLLKEGAKIDAKNQKFRKQGDKCPFFPY